MVATTSLTAGTAKQLKLEAWVEETIRESLNAVHPTMNRSAHSADNCGKGLQPVRMRSLSMLPVAGQALSTTSAVGRETFSMRRNIYPEPTAAENNARPQQQSQSQSTCKKPVRWVTMGMKVLVGFMAFTCFCWTVWLILLAIKPNDTVNWVMKTDTFDNGSFWLMVDPPRIMNACSVCGLSLVAITYLLVIFKLLRTRKRVKQYARSSRIDSMKAALRSSVAIVPVGRRRSRAATLLTQTVLLIVKHDSYAVEVARVWIKFADLAVESMILYQILEAGSPLVLVTTFTAIIGTNALSCALMMLLPQHFAGLTEVIVDTVFDFFIVVLYPMLMVIYCLSSFSFDHKKIAINLSVFPTGSFERNASVIADPVQTGIIYEALKSLQIFSFWDFCLRVGVHIIFSHRLARVAEIVQDPSKRPGRLYPKRHFVSATFFIVFTISLIIFVHKSVWSSSMACLPHPECAVKAHRWTLVERDSLTQCPCLALIDGDLAPNSFDSWLQPVNVIAKVVQLASTGDLKTIQLTNRYFPVFPYELRRCRHMRHLSLVYTHTESMPTWIKEYTKLEYLYVEGTFDSSLLELPDGMFDNMKSLTFIHLGMHLRLQTIPSFGGLRNLKALALALFVSLAELPAFDHLYNLERLVLTYVPRIEILPDLKSVQNLKAFSVNDRGAWCCNGFLGDCKLQDPFCAGNPFWGVPPASCLPPTKVASEATKAIVKKFSSTVCRKEETNSPGPGFPSPETIAQCNGVMYRKCTIPGYPEAMCYNARFMAIFCMPDPFVIEMRRQQIQQSVGDPCRPEVEAWLGCN